MLRYVGWVVRSLRKDLRLGNYVGIWQKILSQLGAFGKLAVRLTRLTSFELISLRLDIPLTRPVLENLAAACRRNAVELELGEVGFESSQVQALSYRQRALALWLVPVWREVSISVQQGKVTYRTVSQTGPIRWQTRHTVSEFSKPVSVEALALRELARLALIDFDVYLKRWAETLPNGGLTSTQALVLYLPEVGMRNHQLGSEDFVGFAGLTAPQGWLGCARSYRELAKLAIELDLASLTVIEDDAVLGHEWRQRVDDARRQVESGVFSTASGLASDLEFLPAGWEARSSSNGRYFVGSAFSSTVFTIFGRPALEWLAKFPSHSTDPNTGAIDRYLAELPELKAAVFVPPLVTHMPDASSTLWSFGNRTYDAQIEATEKLIADAVELRLGRG